MGGNTVRGTARAAVPDELLSGRRQPRPSRRDPYKPHLDQHWADAVTNAIRVHAELQDLDYRGTYQTYQRLPPAKTSPSHPRRRPCTTGRPAGHRLDHAAP
ncbi:hypothetical protein [Streptomyces sp. NPDC058255]|uniref:hypothetical protein n=1 Tax=Streptomyces sp. NPDC058255 TaxID=3346407 RepID=UPI0036EE80BA